MKVGLINLGCPKNQVDSEIMLGLLKDAGFELTCNEEEAEIVVVNTCGFIDAAKQESIHTLIQLGELKKSGQCRLLIAAGCLPQRYKAELLKDPGVTGTSEKPHDRVHCRRGRTIGQGGRCGGQPGCPGHNGLWKGFKGTSCPGAPVEKVSRYTGHQVDTPSLHLSGLLYKRVDSGNGRGGEAL